MLNHNYSIIFLVAVTNISEMCKTDTE